MSYFGTTMFEHSIDKTEELFMVDLIFTALLLTGLFFIFIFIIQRNDDAGNDGTFGGDETFGTHESDESDGIPI